MKTEITSNLNHLGKSFTVQTRNNHTEGMFIETGVFDSDAVIFSRKTSYGQISKSLNNPEKLKKRLVPIMRGQHNMVLKELEEGKYDSLFGISEKYVLSESERINTQNSINVQRINLALNNLKKILATSLLASYFWDEQGHEIVTYSILPKNSRIFNQLSNKIRETLKGPEYPSLGKHYVLDMVDNYIIALIPFKNYHWGLLIDTDKINFKTLINTIIPNAIQSFEEIFY